MKITYTEIGRGRDPTVAHVSASLHVAPFGRCYATLDIPPSELRETFGRELARRWNVHDDLLAALRECVELLAQPRGLTFGGAHRVICLGRARKALAKAEEES